jgi:hypothetical protein
MSKSLKDIKNKFNLRLDNLLEKSDASIEDYSNISAVLSDLSSLAACQASIILAKEQRSEKSVAANKSRVEETLARLPRWARGA